jgi:ribonuclease G
MSTWLYEQGIGEERAIRVHKGEIIEAIIVDADRSMALGAIVCGRITALNRQSTSARVLLTNGQEAYLSPIPDKLTEGMAVSGIITREALTEASMAHHRTKPPIIRACPVVSEPQAAPSLLQQLSQDNIVQQCIDPAQDRFAEAGWHDLLAQAETGVVAFPGGNLIISPTPAMTLIDVDGDAPPLTLAKEAAVAAAHAILRLNIGGSIVIDFPSLPAKADRNAVADAFDTALSGARSMPHERTAINGFGLMQIVRKRQRPSLVERARNEPVRFALMQVLRRAERSDAHGPVTLNINAKAATVLDANPVWLETLSRRIGRAVSFEMDSNLEPHAFSLS